MVREKGESDFGGVGNFDLRAELELEISTKCFGFVMCNDLATRVLHQSCRRTVRLRGSDNDDEGGTVRMVARLRCLVLQVVHITGLDLYFFSAPALGFDMRAAWQRPCTLHVGQKSSAFGFQFYLFRLGLRLALLADD